MPYRTLAAGLTLGIILAATAPSAAQHALGGGAALDGSLFGGPNRFNQAAPLPNYRSRNLLVTGNVAGGRGFRDTVGYGAEFDFRGETGSDDLFTERANSAFSAPVGIALARSKGDVKEPSPPPARSKKSVSPTATPAVVCTRSLRPARLVTTLTSRTTGSVIRRSRGVSDSDLDGPPNGTRTPTSCVTSEPRTSS